MALDVRDQGMAWLWHRVFHRTNRRRHVLTNQCMELWIEQCKFSEKALERSQEKA